MQPRRIRFRVAGPGAVVGSPVDLSAPAGCPWPRCRASLPDWSCRGGVVHTSPLGTNDPRFTTNGEAVGARKPLRCKDFRWSG